MLGTFDSFLTTRTSNIKTVLEHRLVLAHSLGRPLKRFEVVHHRNGNRGDNRLENLQLFKSGRHHQGHGDHYHEVERLQARIHELEAQLRIDTLQKQ